MGNRYTITFNLLYGLYHFVANSPSDKIAIASHHEVSCLSRSEGYASHSSNLPSLPYRVDNGSQKGRYIPYTRIHQILKSSSFKEMK